ncbi:gliding motility-associated C-terminal domain-containing protein [Hymenobacter sp. CRA2]|uniref:T9SS type B sorting domain-containing protein n=1 Tax=Hymenobacter sp. CRA2 TaxID=1955620 RepID=UPI00098E8AA8|nr:gliding motility-associated C-terminal domain-containing protein [Hymenobacter sp. CRA2]OON70278.1 hypothetical protein B0919_05980 [Hymenobacter sp. CRA2]
MMNDKNRLPRLGWRQLLRGWAMFLACWLGAQGLAVAQLCPNDSPGATSCFRVYDDATGQPLDIPNQPVTVLCANSRIRLRDCSGENFIRGTIFYALGCTPGAALNADSIRTVPPTTGPLIIQQNTPNPHPGQPGFPGGAGILFSRRFEVRERPQPDFTVAYCGSTNAQIQVTLSTMQANVRYEVQVGTGPRQPVTQASATYTVTPGATTVRVFGNYTDARICEGMSEKTFAPPPAPRAPVLQRLTVQATGLELAFAPLQNDYRYVLEQDGGTGTFTTVATIPSSATTFTVPNGNLNSCYRLRLTDACGILSLPSAPLCPIDLSVASANRQNQLSWAQTAGSPVTGYDVRRNAQPLATAPASARTYTDSDVTCGVTYQYQVVARTAAGVSESAVRSVQTVASQAAPAPLLTASFRPDGTVEINTQTAVSDTASRLLVRRTLGSTTADVPVSRQRPVLDQPGLVTPELVPCYTSRLSDPCGNVSTEGPSACPPVLAAEAADRDGNQVQVRWSAPAGQGSGWSYRLLLLDAGGQVLSTSSLNGSGAPILAPAPPNDRQVLRYRLEATSSTGLVVYSNVAQLVRQVVVTIPNAFTPNGDGLNDVLEIKGRFLTTFTFRLFDRNGLEVFRATDRTQTWNGKVRGVQAAPQVFSYQFTATDEAGQPVVRRGTVTILR